MELRKAYVAKLLELMQKNKKIVILDADLAAAGGTKPIYQQFPKRAFDVGIAESNMTCMAVGMSAYGYIPFIHSFAPFCSRRNFDQIAVSISYSEQNVKIMAFDPGITATSNGGTHMTFEDVAMMRALPNIVVMDIVDWVQMREALPQIANHKGSVYVRMARKQTEQLFDENTYRFKLGKADKLSEGKDITIISTGCLTIDASRAVQRLKEQGINAELLCMATIKPLDEQAVLQSAKKTNAVLTVENHSVHGGLYSAVTELLSREYPCRCDAVAVYDRISQVGSLNDLKRDYQLTEQDIVDKAVALVNSKRK